MLIGAEVSIIIIPMFNTFLCQFKFPLLTLTATVHNIIQVSSNQYSCLITNYQSLSALLDIDNLLPSFDYLDVTLIPTCLFEIILFYYSPNLSIYKVFYS